MSPHAPEEREYRALQRRRFNQLRANGVGITAAARMVRVSRQAASAWEKDRVGQQRQGSEPAGASLPFQRACAGCGEVFGRGSSRGRPPRFCPECREKRTTGSSQKPSQPWAIDPFGSRRKGSPPLSVQKVWEAGMRRPPCLGCGMIDPDEKQFDLVENWSEVAAGRFYCDDCRPGEPCPTCGAKMIDDPSGDWLCVECRVTELAER